MDYESPIKTYDEEVKVITYADTCRHRYVIGKTLQAEDSILRIHTRLLHVRRVERYILRYAASLRPALHIPDITSIDEQRSVERAEEPGPVLQAREELQVTIGEQIHRVLVVIIRRSWSDGTRGESSKVICATHIVSLREWGVRRVAIRMHISCECMCYDLVVR